MLGIDKPLNKGAHGFILICRPLAQLMHPTVNEIFKNEKENIKIYSDSSWILKINK
jgi:hypothetical protein